MRALSDRLGALKNDFGLLAENYDVKRHQQVGNVPQAFSHLALIGAAHALAAAESKAKTTGLPA
jgi:GH15 family glucan-1,4-alpha-glucosidase